MILRVIWSDQSYKIFAARLITFRDKMGAWRWLNVFFILLIVLYLPIYALFIERKISSK